MRKAFWTFTTALFFTLAGMLALMSPTSVRADDGDASSNPRESCSTSVGCKVDSTTTQALCEEATSVVPIKECGNTNSFTEVQLRSGVVVPPQALRSCLHGEACAQLPPLQANGDLLARQELKHWLLDTGNRQRTGETFARPWVVSNPMAEHCKKMAAAGGKNGEILLEYCMAQAMGGPDATKARNCYAKHPGEVADFKACLSDMKESKPLSSPPRTQSAVPPVPDMSDIKARTAREEAAQRALIDSMFAAGNKAAGTPKAVTDTIDAIYEKVVAVIKSNASNSAGLYQFGTDKDAVDKIRAHYNRLKQIDPEGAGEMLNVAVKGRVTALWNNELIAKGQQPGSLSAGAQQRYVMEEEAKKTPELTLVEHYRDHDLPIYPKPLRQLNVSDEDKVLLAKWKEYGFVQGALDMKYKGTESFGPTARLLGLSEKDVLAIVQEEQRRLEKLQKNGEIARDVNINPQLITNLEKIFTDRYVTIIIPLREKEPKRDDREFLSSVEGERNMLRFMEAKENFAKASFVGNCDWVEGKYHVPNGTPLCHDNKVKSAEKN